MKDYDIKIRNNSEIRIYGTKDNTIVFPADVKLDADHDQADIDILQNTNAVIGLPGKAEHVELNIEDAKLKIEDVVFERCEIDAKGVIEVDLSNVTGSIDINMVGGKATLLVPADYKFRTNCEGKGNAIECEAAEYAEASNVIELNGKNSTLTIKVK